MNPKLIRDNFRAFFKLAARLKPYGFRVGATIFSGIGNHAATIATSAFCAYVVGLALTNNLKEKMPFLAIILAVLVLLRVTFYFAEMWLAHDVAFKVLADFRIYLLRAIERVSPAILLDMHSGQLASTLMSDVELLEWFFAHSFGSIIVAVITSVVLLLYLGSFHIALSIVAFICIVVLIAIPNIMQKRASVQGAQVRQELGDANAVTVEGIQGMKEILMLNQVRAYHEKNQKYMQKMYDSQLQYGKRLGTEGALLQGAVGVGMLAIISTLVILVLHGELEKEYLPMLVMLSGMTFTPVVEVCHVARNFGLIFAAANRVFTVIDAEPLVEDSGIIADVKELTPEIVFDNVVFKYNDNSKNAVDGISFTIQANETVALVGASGAGKSTCIQLLMRNWEVESGNIYIGGVNIKEMKLEALRSMISPVLQEVYLFHDTLKENMRLGKLNADNESIINASKQALAHEFISRLPQGYDTIAGERGSRFSGGQKQRIAIARALVKGAPILILDEAVSNLDTENEKEIQEALRRSAGNRTTLIVAHRLSTILSADRLLVLENGRIVQTGTHETLIAQEGVYKSIVLPKMQKEDVNQHNTMGEIL